MILTHIKIERYITKNMRAGSFGLLQGYNPSADPMQYPNTIADKLTRYTETFRPFRNDCTMHRIVRHGIKSKQVRFQDGTFKPREV